MGLVRLPQGGIVSRKSGIGLSLVWLVLASILPIIAFSAGMAWLVVDRQKAAVEEDLRSTSRALMIAVDRQLDSELAAMRVMATGHSLDSDKLDHFAERARRVMAEHPQWLDVVLVDPKSHLIVGGPLGRPDPPPTASDPDAIDRVAASGQPLVVGAFTSGKITRQPMILLLAPVSRSGEVRYVMTVILDPASLNAIFAAQHLPASWIGVAVDSRLRIAARSRTPERFIGRPVTATLAAHIAADVKGLFTSVNQEGEQVKAVFSRSASSGWTVTIGLPEDEFERPIRRAVAEVLAAGGALVVLALLLAGLVGRAIVRRRRTYEDALEEREARYRALFSYAKAVMLLVDPIDGTIVDANAAAAEFYGIAIESLKGMAISRINTLGPDEIAAEMLAARQQHRNHFNFRHRLANDEIRDVEVHSGPLEINGRELLYSIVHDITDRIRAEAAQKASEERMRLFFERQAVGTAITSPDKGWLQVNDRLCRMLGYRRDELSGLTWAALTHPDDLAADEAQFVRMLGGEIDDYALEKRFIRKDGAVVHAEVSVACVRRPDRSVDYVLALVVDISARKEAEQKLASAASRYQSLLKTASDGVHILDERGNLVEASDSFLRMLGYSQDQTRSLNVRDWDAQFAPEDFEARMADHLIRPTMFETRHRRADGSVFEVEINSIGIEFEGSRHVYCASRDITERKRLERELLQSEQRFRSLVEATTDWVWETDAEHRFTWISPSFDQISGMPATSILGRYRWDLASPEHDIEASRWQAYMADLGAFRSFRDFRYWLKTGDGQARWVSVSGSPRFDETGQFLGYRGSGADITEKAAQSTRIRLLSTVVEQSPVSVVITDPDGTIEYVNQHFTTVTGYDSAEVIGRNSRLLASGETAVDIYRDMWERITAGQRWTGELHNRRKDGSLHWEMMVIAPVRDEMGQIAHYVAVKEDVSERHALQEKLRQTNAELEQFAYVASHDLRQPLRMVTSYLGLIEKRLGEVLTDDTRSFLGFAVDGAKRMDRLILDLLDYSRTGHSKNAVAVPLDEPIANARINLTVAIREAEAELVVAEDLPTVQGDPGELTRLFQNLIGNAVKYRAPERVPRIEIACRRQGHEWLLSVKDNGIGIAAADRERAFAIFQRLVPQGDYEGTGIGLAVCKKIVEHHGGRIWIDSGPEPGCTVMVALPVMPG